MLRYLPMALLFLGAGPRAEAATAPGARKADSCSIASLPEPQRRRLIEGYASRRKSQGKASADAWARAQQDAVHRQLIAMGACPAAAKGGGPVPQQQARASGKTILNKRGEPCRNIEVENQIFPGFGGEPMRLALVQVCKD